MSDHATLSALKARVEAATGPDRELDAEIAKAFGWRLLGHRRFWEAPKGWIRLQDIEGLPPFARSIDYALALFDRELPRWSREVGCSGFGDPAWCRAWNPMLAPGEDNTIRADHDCGSEPLAILSALLTAKIAQLEVDHAR